MSRDSERAVRLCLLLLLFPSSPAVAKEENAKSWGFIKTKLWLLRQLHAKLIRKHKANLPPKFPSDQLLKAVFDLEVILFLNRVQRSNDSSAL